MVYTDIWASMGQEAEPHARARAVAGYQVTPELMANADLPAVFMHCLPCYRGEEVTADVGDRARSLIFDEVENRLHVQKTVLLMLLNP